jgi:NAD(P)H dehydrogenase (quinone)
LRRALQGARPEKVVCISTIGAQAKQTNLLTQLGIMEESLGDLPVPIGFVRPAWFMENCSWDVASARDTGVIFSFLQPLDKSVPMVSTADVGRVAARLLQETWTGRRVTELEGPARVTPHDIAATFAEIFGHPVRAEAVPRQTWEPLLKSQGMKHPLPRIQMLDGFNQGWINFEYDEASRLKGRVGLKDVLERLAIQSE